MRIRVFRLLPRWTPLVAFVLAALFSWPAGADAAINPNSLLSDYDLTDTSAMSRVGIQQFLNSKGGGIASATFVTTSGTHTAAEILYAAGKYYGISPKYLIILLQKEQTLITTKTPTQRQYDWATGYGVCDSCSKDDPSIQKYKGYFNQVNWAAKRVRESYLADISARGYTISGWGPGITKMTRDGISVTPANAATAALYTYTPWVGKFAGGDERWGGSSVVAKLWAEWFQRAFPDGTLIREESSGNYYLIELGKKRPFRSKNVLVTSYDTKKAIIANGDELAAYETGAPIVFPNYSLIRSPRGTIFLIVDGTKRGIASREVFKTIGFNPEEVIMASWDDINVYRDGPIIDLTSAYPAGALLQSAASGGIVYVESGVRHAIYAREILRSRFAGQKPIKVADDEIAQYAQGDPVMFRDGELVTAPGERSIYVISIGTKRPIASRDVFDRLGYRWHNIVTTTARALEIHPTGEPLVFAETTE